MSGGVHVHEMTVNDVASFRLDAVKFIELNKLKLLISRNRLRWELMA
jgi:hypothetical protein